jgi:hypothetical protein
MQSAFLSYNRSSGCPTPSQVVTNNLSGSWKWMGATAPFSTCNDFDNYGIAVRVA